MKKAEYHIIDAFERQKLCAVGEDSSESFGLQGNQTSQSKVNEPWILIESINSLAFSFLYGPTLTSIHDYWKNHWLDGLDSMIFVFWMLSFKPAFSLSSSTFITRFLNSSLSAIRVVSPAYLRLLIFFLAILIPVCASSSPVFLMMYSAYKLNKQGDDIQPWRTPFPIWNQSVVPCPLLTVASWPVYIFLNRQVRWSGIPIPFSIFHSLLWSTQLKALVWSIKQNRCFSGSLLLCWWSNRCWQFDLWFLFLF